MRRRAPRTLTEQAAANLVAREGRSEPRAAWDAAQITINLFRLAELRREFGRMPTQPEYCERFGITHRTAQRHWAEIRLALPSLDGTDPVESVVQHVALQMRSQDAQTAALSYPELATA